MRGHWSLRPPRRPGVIAPLAGETTRSHFLQRPDCKSGPSGQTLQFQGRGHCRAVLRLSGCASTLPRGHVALPAPTFRETSQPGQVVVSERPGEDGGHRVTHLRSGGVLSQRPSCLRRCVRKTWGDRLPVCCWFNSSFQAMVGGKEFL